MAKPTQEQVDELILSCRFGELDEVKEFTDEFGWESVNAARDDRGNTVLHMVCGNGHLGTYTPPSHTFCSLLLRQIF